MVYGSLDASCQYVDLLKPLENKTFKIKIIQGQDHYFSQNNEDFNNLPEKYLLNINN